MISRLIYLILVVLLFIYPNWAFQVFYIYSFINITYGVLIYFIHRRQFAKSGVSYRKAETKIGLKYASYILDNSTSSLYGGTLFLAQVLNIIISIYYWYNLSFDYWVVIGIINTFISHFTKVLFNPMVYLKGKSEGEYLTLINKRYHNK